MTNLATTNAPHSILTDVQGWETEAEQLALKYLAERVPEEGVIVEIGSEFGMSTSIFAAYSKPLVHVCCVDPFSEGVFLAHYNAMYTLGLQDKISYFKLRSVDAVVEYTRQDRPPINLLFIDGDHHVQSVVDDMSGWLPKLVVGGVAVFHDTTAYTSNYHHEQHDYVQKAIEHWRSGDIAYLKPREFVEVPPVGSMRLFVRIAE